MWLANKHLFNKLGPKDPTNYALEGSIAIAGGVYFVPAFNGVFAPWWRDDARGVCIGITGFTKKSHIGRAVLESMCFQVKDVLDSMHKDFGREG
ncbi:hypothetical protein ACH5RR_031696 [Cinchona calisaya]|uniref:Carbohydrate kinase FGGY C-terminal domain-containing protein n=1 Tax=Cinchona calisaya TaxID=153742 RepID=A0ABD2YIT4_9GENT